MLNRPSRKFRSMAVKMEDKLDQPPPVKLKHKRNFKKTKKIILTIIGLFLALFLWSLLNSGGSVIEYAFSPQNHIKSTDDRVNVLLLGNGGGTHEGPDLTDSIIVASYHLKSHQVTLISIPRDLWVDSTRTKINALYELGSEIQNGSNGLKFAEDKIDDLLGIPIHYAIRIDFSGFAKAIDLVGGVDVAVERTFDDYQYPIEGKEDDLCGYKEEERDLSEDQIKDLNVPVASPDSKEGLKVGKNKVLVDPSGKIATDSADFSCRYEHIHFDKGNSHMDGTMALKYVRSRHALGPEGSDFARSKRQQLVLSAFREKVLSLQTLANPQKVFGLIDTFGKSFETDIPKERFLDFYNLVKKQEGSQSLVLGDLGPGKSILTVPPPADFGGAFVLTPPNNDFTPVKNFLKSELDKQATASAVKK